MGAGLRGVQGLYVRVNIGNTSGGDRRYLVCEVLGIRDKATEYQVLSAHGTDGAQRRGPVAGR
jgi:hypothetical protein